MVIPKFKMNKLPWFTHDHDARNDEFLQRAEDQFGHFGYAAYFKILEIIHQHGTGGILRMSQSRVALNLRSRWPQVRLYLDFCQTSGKVEFKLIGDQVELQNKKFIQRQRNLKSKATSMQPESNSKIGIYKEGEGEEDPPTPRRGNGAIGYKTSTPRTFCQAEKHEGCLTWAEQGSQFCKAYKPEARKGEQAKSH